MMSLESDVSDAPMCSLLQWFSVESRDAGEDTELCGNFHAIGFSNNAAMARL